MENATSNHAPPRGVEYSPAAGRGAISTDNLRQRAGDVGVHCVVAKRMPSFLLPLVWERRPRARLRPVLGRAAGWRPGPSSRTSGSCDCRHRGRQSSIALRASLLSSFAILRWRRRRRRRRRKTMPHRRGMRSHVLGAKAIVWSPSWTAAVAGGSLLQLITYSSPAFITSSASNPD